MINFALSNVPFPAGLKKIIPPSIIESQQAALCCWFSNLVYQRLVLTNQSHILAQLHKFVDFSEIEAACRSYHCQNGFGAPVTHSVSKLVRALCLKYLYDCSLRELEAKIRYDIFAKWFVGYDVFDSGPDHSTISRFENYLILHHARLFFDATLKQIDAAFPHDRSRSQIADTFAVHADAALESLTKRLRHSCQKLLVAFQKADPVAYDRLWQQMDWTRIFGADEERIEYHLSTEQRHDRLLLTLNGIGDCLHRLQEYDLTPSVQKWVDCLQKIMVDELRLERDDAGLIVQVTLLSKKKRGKYPIFSATDPDATIRNHGPNKKDPGYNASVAATTDFIREIRVDTGSQPDPVAIPDLLSAQIEHHDVCPPKLIYDQAAGTGKSVADVREATNGQTQLVAKPKPANKKTKDKFDLTDFVLSDDTLTLTCPNGRSTIRRYRSGSGDGFIFRFPKGKCAGCLLLRQCRGEKYWPFPPDPFALPATHRDVFVSDYRLEKQALIAYSQTDAFKEDMKLRPDIERTISILVLHNGARRARFRGIEKVDFQLKMCGAIYNVKRWLTLLSGKPSKKRRRFGAPSPSREGVGLMAA